MKKTEFYSKKDKLFNGLFDVYRITLGGWEHYHDFVEIVYFLADSGFHFINGKKLNFSKGDVYVIDPYVKHYYTDKHACIGDISVMNCLFDKIFLMRMENPDKINNAIGIFYERLFGELPEQFMLPSYICVKDENGEIYKKFERLESIKKVLIGESSDIEKLKRDQEDFLSCLISLMTDILKRYRQGQVVQNVKNHEENLLNVLAYIDENYEKDISVSELSRIAIMSESYLSRLFKAYTQKSIKEYIQSLRIEKACELLCQTNLSCNDIMLHVGYSDRKYFYRIFREAVGETPLVYRKKSK